VELRAGSRLFCTRGTAEVVVVKAPGGPVELTCNGVQMVTAKASAADGSPAASDTDEVILTGKRYIDEETGAEFLCVKAGPGPLAVGGRVTQLKTAKPLPSSD
jgi:hypothetical protein